MIVNMKKLSLIGLVNEKDMVLKSLMNMGVVEITDESEKLEQKEWAELVERDGDSDTVSKLQQEIRAVESAIGYLSEYDERKKGFFDSRSGIDTDKYEEIVSSRNEIMEIVNNIEKLESRLSGLRSEESKLTNFISMLKPWKSLSIPLENMSTKNTTLSLGIIPESADSDNLEEKLSVTAERCHVEILNSDSEQTYIAVIYHNSCSDNVLDILRNYGFSRVEFRELKGTVALNIENSLKKIDEIKKKRKDIRNNIAAFSTELEKIEIIYDYLKMELERKKVFDRLVKTQNLFVLEGWIPQYSCERVEKHIGDRFNCFVKTEEPGEDEEFPVLLKNHSMVRPFEILTELYSLPNPKTMDASAFLAPFFFIFFGIMLGDAGYGIIMAAISGFILLKFKLKPGTLRVVRLLFFCGVATVLWGILFGDWFGNIFDIISGKEHTLPPIWFSPLDDPVRMLTWSLVFGAVQVYIGIGLKGYLLIRDGKFTDAVFDVGLWYIFLTGIFLFIPANPTVNNIALYMVAGGGILLVLTQGRKQKGILKKILSGVLSLYDTVGYMSDILSYSRLLALGLATGVIASVINTMGTIAGLSNIAGIVIMVVVFVIGHTFNILISSLGAFVHGARLLYVEFFSKFYEGGGRPFKPLKINTKYVYLKNREDE